MGLTLEFEQSLAAAKLTNLFDENRATWAAAAKKAYAYAKGNFQTAPLFVPMMLRSF